MYPVFPERGQTHVMCLQAGVKVSGVYLCTESERGRAEMAEAAALTAQHKLEALAAAQAQQAEHVQSLNEQVRSPCNPYLFVKGTHANQARSRTDKHPNRQLGVSFILKCMALTTLHT